VDPAVYPLAGTVRLDQPAGGNFHALLKAPGQAVIGPVARELLGAHIGDRVHLTSESGSFDVTIAGILPSSGLESSVSIFASLETVNAGATQPPSYAAVYINTPNHAAMVAAAADLRQRFPLGQLSTTDDVLKNQQDNTKAIRQFLQIAGLLALLVGGIGVVNTMQVLLTRSRIEIAMLKTAGYRRRDLYALFGLQAVWLGLIGGLLGAVLGFGLSFGVIKLIEGILLQDFPLTIDAGVILSGILIGLVTALIFGLLPIVQAAAVRPLAVIRELPERSWRTRLQTGGLLLLLAVLFTAFASVILDDLKFAAIAVSGTLAVLAVLTAVFGFIAWSVSKLPVPERFSPRYLLLAVPAVLIAGAVTLALPSVGIVLALFAVMMLAVVVLPRSWKSTAKLAYRGIGRQPGRTAATLVALFVGVFTVGLMLILGQDIRSRFNDLIARSLSYSLAAIERDSRAHLIEQALPGIPGLQGTRRNTYGVVVPLAVNGQSVADLAARVRQATGQGQNAFALLAQIEGSNLAGGQVPHIALPKSSHAGRALQVSDAGTNNILVDGQLMDKPFNLKPGDTITLGTQSGTQTRTVTIVGFFDSSPGQELHTGNLLADDSVVKGLAGDRLYQVWLLKVDSPHRAQAFRILSDADPQASMIDFTDFVAFFDQLLGNVIVFLSAIASLALLAGLVIIANTVALAMLERRREIGILKSVGYGSRAVLGQVLLENGLVGAIGGMAAVAMVTLATTLLGRLLFKLDLAVSTPLALLIIIVTSLLAAGTAAMVAWKPVRVRPLEVLRYE
jgi:putative ABC transport system permease protein